MKVGIDARCLARQLTGIGYYCLHIVQELKNNKDIDLILFSPSTFNIDKETLKGTKIVHGNCKGSISRQIWGEVHLPKLIKKHHIDVFWGPSHRIPLLLSHKKPSVLTIHDLIWRKAPKTMAKTTRMLETLFMPPSLRKAHVVIADSLSTANDIKHYYPQLSNKIRHIPLGPGFFYNKNQTKNENSDQDLSKPYILFIGTLEPRKNLISLLEAFNQLPSDLKTEFNLIIAGGKGWGNVDLNSKISSLNIQESVNVLGYIDKSEMIALCKNAYILAMPSLYEGFGFPILEAQSYGVPVITSDNSSMPEVAGEGAIITNPYSVESIKSALEQILSNRSLRQKLSEKALINVQKYCWDKTAELTLKAFKEAANLNKH